MPSESSRAIAILGMACRLPQANTPAQFWSNLTIGKSSIQEVPAERWSVAEYYDPTPGAPGKSMSKWGGFIEGVREFDAAFFDITPDEAAVMDPQHRILLELAYAALESAGYAGDRRKRRRIGVFVGISHNSYEEFTRPLLLSGEPVPPSMVADNLRNLAAGRIAHSLDLTGPNLAIDTACSSSLVALHYARLSLLAGECDLALVGGINLNLTATPFVAFSSAGALSPSSRTNLFDERADGFVLGEGGGMVVLAPLEQAQAEGDPILAVIRGSAVNNDGRSHGLMTPNPVGQQAVMADAYRDAQVDPDTVSYIEAHGTGTQIGDAVEARSLTRIFNPPSGGGCRYVGSVKTNVGHLLSGAGMASLIKVILALKHRQIPPSLNCEQPRSRLHLERAGFVVNTAVEAWRGPAPRRAGINAFGFGGTNAHV
ncbi:MAG: polyketide synthase, partial [Chloroflexota bacterium]|nr:polyketide synthase [Chloroflexota bacterium]